MHFNAAAAQGYSRNEQGYEDGVFSVAAPILGHDGYAIGAIAVAMPLSRSNKATTDLHARAARNAASAISTKLFGALPVPRQAQSA